MITDYGKTVTIVLNIMLEWGQMMENEQHESNQTFFDNFVTQKRSFPIILVKQYDQNRPF